MADWGLIGQPRYGSGTNAFMQTLPERQNYGDPRQYYQTLPYRPPPGGVNIPVQDLVYRAQPGDMPRFYQPASIRYNNPGAMYPGQSATSYGSTSYGVIGGGHKIAQFDSPEAGAAAQFDLLGRGYVGLPLGQALTKWSGGNSSPAYIASVARATGMSPDTVLTADALRNPLTAVPLAKAMARVETGRDYPMTDQQWAAAHRMYVTRAGGSPQSQRDAFAIDDGSGAGWRDAPPMTGQATMMQPKPQSGPSGGTAVSGWSQRAPQQNAFAPTPASWDMSGGVTWADGTRQSLYGAM